MGRFGTVARAAFVACAAVMALLVWVASAAAASWRSLHTSGQLDISDLVGTARGGDGVLHVAWQRRAPDGLYDLVQTPVTATGAVRSPTPIVSGWASIEGPTLLASGSALFAFFSGTQTLVTGDPHEGVDYAVTADGGTTWALAPTAVAAGDFAGQRDASVALGPDGALSSWYAGDETVVHFGTDPAAPDQPGVWSGNRSGARGQRRLGACRLVHERAGTQRSLCPGRRSRDRSLRRRRSPRPGLDVSRVRRRR
jgi:hypothetical protein